MPDDAPPSDPDADDPELLELLRDVAKLPDRVPLAAGDLSVPSTLDVPREVLERMHAVQQPKPPQVGTTLDDRYRIDGELGRGGMGIVYRATNLRTGKNVALKWMAIVESGAHAAALSERFRREARAAARIRHENVVDVYDVGGTDRAPFLVMELLEGESLRACLERGPLSLEQAQRVMTGVFRGVSAAHRAGVIHRDLKPDNIFLCHVDGGREVAPKVLDFGVAAMRKDAADGLFTLTRSGAIVGTPAYMAPEQLVAKSVDARTDVYSLGVVLFEMLTGRLPFEAKSASELAVKQATEEPARASKFRPELRGAVDRVLEKALAREPEDRFADVSAFETAFARASDPAEALVQTKKQKTRRALSAVLLLVAGVVIVVLLRAGLNDSTQAPVKPLPAKAARKPTNVAPNTVEEVRPVEVQKTPSPSETNATIDEAAGNPTVSESPPTNQSARVKQVGPRTKRASEAQPSSESNRASPRSATSLSIDDF